MKKFLLLLLIIGGMTKQSFAQDKHLVDSLQTLLKTAKKDTTRANILYQLSGAYWYNNPNTAMDYAKQTLALSEKIGYKKGIGNAYNSMGNINNNKGDYLPALEHFKKSLKIREEIGDKQGIAGSYNNIGLIYSDRDIYPEALKNYFASLKIWEQIGNKHGLAVTLNNIGFVYTLQCNYPEALKNHFAALKINQEIGDKTGIAYSYDLIGVIYQDQYNYPEALKNYFASLKIWEQIGNKRGIAICANNIGDICAYQGNYPEALKNYFASLKIEEEIGDKHYIAHSYNSIGDIYRYQGNYPEALKNYFASLKIEEEIGDEKGISYSYIGIGEIYTKQKKNNEASRYLNNGLSIAKEIGSLADIKESYIGLAYLDSAEGNFKQAWMHYKMYIITRDSMFNQKNTKKIAQIEFDKKEAVAKAEQEKKDALAQKELQKQKLVRNGFIGGFSVVLLFAVVFFTQRNKIKKGKTRSDELLLNILPSEVAEELKSKGSADAKQFDEVTVMFTDFKDFTQISEKLTPAELVSEIDTCFKAFDDFITKYNIEKIKTIGDSYMCAGGLPVSNTTHATDVLKAALEIQQFMQQHIQHRKDENKDVFEIRIGIHTGPVVAGIVGNKKFAYDIWGDTVNIASRMESSGEVGKVNISGSTYELVKDKFNCTYRGKIVAKHKGEVDMYFVESKGFDNYHPQVPGGGTGTVRPEYLFSE